MHKTGGPVIPGSDISTNCSRCRDDGINLCVGIAATTIFKVHHADIEPLANLNAPKNESFDVRGLDHFEL